MSSPLTELNWIVIIGVFAATVLAHALPIVAAARAKERWGRRRAGSEIAVHRREVLGQGCSRTSGGHAAGVAVESHGVGGLQDRSPRVTLDEKIEPLRASKARDGEQRQEVVRRRHRPAEVPVRVDRRHVSVGMFPADREPLRRSGAPSRTPRPPRATIHHFYGSPESSPTCSSPLWHLRGCRTGR